MSELRLLPYARLAIATHSSARRSHNLLRLRFSTISDQFRLVIVISRTTVISSCVLLFAKFSSRQQNYNFAILIIMLGYSRKMRMRIFLQLFCPTTVRFGVSKIHNNMASGQQPIKCWETSPSCFIIIQVSLLYQKFYTTQVFSRNLITE